MTEEGAIIGTAQYLSPEQARGAPVDQTSDLYSTGIVLYELLTATVPFTGETPVEIAMKHLSEVPDAPSELRREVPDDLDLVVLRALSKEPADRYQSAAAMDADLETVAHGGHVPVETAEAATMVLGGGRTVDSTGVTQVTRRARPSAGYPPPFDPTKKRRGPVWPWLAGAGALLLLVLAGFLLYEPVKDQLQGSSSVKVPYVVGLRQAQAEADITDKGLQFRSRQVSSSDVAEGFVISQDPAPGTDVDEGEIVSIEVSSGKPKVTIPTVVGQDRDSAFRELTQAGLDVRIVEVNSEEEEGRVTAQQPAAGTVVVEGTSVRINVSKGPRPVVVPNVIGLPFGQADAELERRGFNVNRVDGSSDLQEGIVFDQDPSAETESSRGATVTVSVSRGPATVAVPDVTLQDAAIGRTTLENAGFRVREVLEDTTDPNSDGVVVGQDPVGSSQAEPGSLVTIFVGQLVESGDTTTTDTETIPTTP
jgi:eukaryotic-like serine/threonine-protein kinase